MSDLILVARLAALGDNLNRLGESANLIKEGLIDRGLIEHTSARRLYDDVSTAIQEQTEYAQRKIEEISAQLETADDDDLVRAWQDFAGLEAEMRLLFSSCLELIGGVAFRDQGRIAESLWRVADSFNVELCRQALKQGLSYVAIPASEEALSDSIVRTIRLRFPEWTVWSLPLIGYEFGHAAIGSREGLKEVMRKQVERLVAVHASADFPQAGGQVLLSQQEQLLRQVCERRVQVLLADAVATYMLGPSYACATIHLRLDPLAATVDSAMPQERARVVLTCLRAMDRENGSANGRFVDDLEAQWNDVVRRARPLGTGADARLADLDGMLDAFVEELRYLPQVARLVSSGWSRASLFASVWSDQLSRTALLQLDLTQSDSLRDILNAAWLLRLREPKWTSEIERGAVDACVKLVDEVRKEPRGGTAGWPGGPRHDSKVVS